MSRLLLASGLLLPASADYRRHVERHPFLQLERYTRAYLDHASTWGDRLAGSSRVTRLPSGVYEITVPHSAIFEARCEHERPRIAVKWVGPNEDPHLLARRSVYHAVSSWYDATDEDHDPADENVDARRGPVDKWDAESPARRPDLWERREARGDRVVYHVRKPGPVKILRPGSVCYSDGI